MIMDSTKKLIFPGRKEKYPQGRAIRPTRGDRVLDTVIIILLILTGIVVAYPIWLVMIASISDPSYISTGQVWILPKGLNLDAYNKLWATKQIWLGYRNSLFYTFAGTSLQMAVTTTCAFALSRPSLPGRRVLSLYFLFIMYFSGGLIPTYFVVKDLNMVNTVWALLLPGIFGPITWSSAAVTLSTPSRGNLRVGADRGRQHVPLLPAAGGAPGKAHPGRDGAELRAGPLNSYFNAMLYISDDNIQSLQVFIKRITQAAAAGGCFKRKHGSHHRQVRETQLLKYAVVVVSTCR